MPNIASILKDEIMRLARKEVRKEVESLKKSSAQYRSDIAAIKRQVSALERQLARQGGKTSKQEAPNAEGEESTRHRFSAKGFASHRQKLSLTAAQMGALVGVSAQTVYNWEAGKVRPRKQQIVAIAAVRTLGKKQIKAKLETSSPE